MSKYLVETFYTCTFKVKHFLDKIDQKELESLEQRDDGEFEVIDIKIDTRKTKSLEKKKPIWNHRLKILEYICFKIKENIIFLQLNIRKNGTKTNKI